MRVVVCVKHVPELSSPRSFGADLRTVRVSEDSTLNEVDENAVEAALQLRDAAPAGGGGDEVVAVTMGPDIAADAVRRALQMGADRGVHINDDQLAGADYAVTCAALVAAISRVGEVDAVVMGMTALDGLGSVVPAMVAAQLGWPALTVARSVEFREGKVRIERDIDAVVETLSAPLPAVISVTDVTNSPRLVRMKEMMAARAKPIEKVGVAELGLDAAAVAPRAQVLEINERPQRETDVVFDDGTGGAKLVAYLKQQGVPAPAMAAAPQPATASKEGK